MEKVELPLLKASDRERVIPISVIVGLIIMLFILLLACLSMTFKNTYKLHYSESSNLDYRVYLKENDYYQENYLPKDRKYVSSLIDYIDADFDYTFKSDENLGLEYSYYVKGELVVFDSEGTIYSKTYDLVNKQKFVELSNNIFSVSENVKINYDQYNSLAEGFIDAYAPGSDAKLVVSLYVDIVGKHAEFDKKLNDEAVEKLIIPLTSRTMNIEMDYDLSNSKDATLQYRSAVINNPILLTIAIILAIMDICAIIAVIIWVIVNRDEKTLYTKKLNKILKDYERYVSETVITERVEDMMKTRSLRIEVIKSFEDLIDLRDNLGKPILYHEECPGEEAVFYILADRTGYIYVLRASDLKKNKKNENTVVTNTTKTNKKSENAVVTKTNKKKVNTKNNTKKTSK